MYCNKCGSRNVALGLKNLSGPCSPSSGYSLASLMALKEGKLPHNLDHWPDEPPKSNPTDVVTRHGGVKRQGGPLPNTKRVFKQPVVAHLVAVVSSHHTLTQHAIPVSLSPHQVYLGNLQDMLDLEDAGEKVVWPNDLSYEQAKQLLPDENYVSMRNYMVCCVPSVTPPMLLSNTGGASSSGGPTASLPVQEHSGYDPLDGQYPEDYDF